MRAEIYHINCIVENKGLNFRDVLPKIMSIASVLKKIEIQKIYPIQMLSKIAKIPCHVETIIV